MLKISERALESNHHMTKHSIHLTGEERDGCFSSFTPGPTLYYALVHEFGRSIVEDAFDSFLGEEESSNLSML